MVGKRVAWIYIVFSFVMMPLQGTVSLELHDEQGKRITRAYVGRPFILQAVVSEGTGHIEYPKIKGLKHFTVRKSGFQMQSINGVSTTRYRYEVRIDAPGVYELGPAKVKMNKRTEESPTITVTVADEQPHETNKRTEEPFVQLTVDDERFWVGEKIVLTLRLYAPTLPSIDAIGMPEELKGPRFSLAQVSEPVTGSEQRNGTSYEYAQWQMEIYPKESGTIVIPAFSVDYRDTARKRRGMFGLFGIFDESKRAYSNALTLEIDSLPSSVSPQTPVGTVNQFTAMLDQTTIVRGQGAVLTLTIEGDLNFQQVVIDQLEQMPPALKWYPSKQEIQPDKKKFEFVIQGVEAGNWTIPAQRIGFFDVSAGEYRELQSKPLLLTVEPSADRTSQITKTSGEQQAEQEQLTNDVLPLNSSGAWYRQLPWQLEYTTLFFLMIAPLIALFVWMLSKRGYYWLRMRRSALCASARRRVHKAEKIRNPAALYSIMMTLCIQLRGTSEKYLSQEELCECATMRFQDQHLIKEWYVFVEKLYQVSFSDKQLTRDDDIFRQAQAWINRWEKHL